MAQDHSIIYMGTPEFAVEPLKRLIDEGFNVKAVVTVADKPSGRGLKMHSSPVKSFAVDHNIPVLQPSKLSDPEFIDQLKHYNADLFIVVAFRKLPELVWRMPSLGCFNLHASLLPQYRGAAPINHAVINGESTTGVTTFFINNEIDTGSIILQRKTHIGPDETAGELHDRLMVIGADLVAETVKTIFNGSFKTIEQTSSGSLGTIEHPTSKKAPKIFRDDCRINWEHDASYVHNFIRGLSPHPGAFSVMTTNEGDKELKVLKSALTDETTNSRAGTLIIRKERMYVACADRLIELLTVKPSGKKAMSSSEFLRGNRSELINFLYNYS